MSSSARLDDGEFGLRPLGDDYVIAARDEVAFHHEYRFELRDPFNDAYRILKSGRFRLTQEARRLLAQHPVGGTNQTISRLVESGRLVLLRPPEQAPPYSVAEARASKAEPSSDSVTEASSKLGWIEYQFVDAADQPLGELPFQLELTSGQTERGTLPPDGRVRREPLPEGTCTAKIGGIEEARWSTPQAGMHEAVELQIATSGIDAGTSVRFEIFRLYREQAGDALAQLSATIDARGDARARWTCPDPENNAARMFIFKATIGGLHRKSGVLTLERRAVSAEWSASHVYHGDSVSLLAELRGVADGTAATFRIHEKNWLTGEDREIEGGTLNATVQGGRATAAWTSSWRPSDDKTGCDTFVHCYFIVDAGGLSAHSNPLQIWPVFEHAAEGGSRGAAYCVRDTRGRERQGVLAEGGKISERGFHPNRSYARVGGNAAQPDRLAQDSAPATNDQAEA